MKWLVKVAAFKLLSTLPGGASLYRFGQEQLTKSLVPTRERVDQKLQVGERYFEWLKAQGKEQQLLQGTHLDFGAGWHPSIPLLYYAMGCNKQYLFDLVSVLDRSMVQQTIETVLSIISSGRWPGRLKRLPPRLTDDDWRGFLRNLGITYHAPYAEMFPQLAEQLDVVTSTQVLLHIPREPMLWCFEQIHRSLKAGGLFLATIHLRDLLATAQGLSKYNHLRYSTTTWERWINSRLMSYNRFRAIDYRQLLEQAGFEIIDFEVEGGTPEDFQELEKIPIADSFKKYSREELAAKHLFFVARKR